VGLARGYLGRPELTAERFVPDPLSDRPGQRLYRTGDLVRWLADGTLEFLGRLDQQVKVRGFRVELGEIEAALAECPGTHEVAVAVTGEPSATLTAYVVAGEGAGLTEAELRTRLRARLPDYMVPSRIVFLDRLPLTPNGKIDRKALAQGDLTERGAEEGLAAPRTQVEELLTGVFGEVLRVDRVGMGDNFFDLGGHSLIATQLVSRVRESLGVDLPLNHVFASPTVMALAEKIEELRRQRMTVQPPELAPVSRQRKLPLSFAQQRLWTLDQLEPLGPTYNTNLSLTVQGNLQVGALMKALKEVLRRHEVLRTSFLADAGEPFQVIAEGLSFELPVVDLKTLGEDDRKLEVERLSLDEARRPFVLAQAPLLRCTLVLLGTEEQVLLLTMHHIISDGWSLGILVREVSSLYESFSAGETSRLPELPIQYADFAHWQRSWLTGEVLEKYLSFWRCNLQGAPDMLRLPVDRARPEVRGHRGERQYFQISQELSAALRDLCRQEGVTLFMALFAVLNTLLYRYSGQTDIVVGTPVANRPLVKTEGLIGFFINTLPLRTRLLGTTRFRELLKQVRQQVLEAFDHQDLPLEKVIEEIRPGRHLSHTPLYQVVFGMQNAPLPVLDRPEAGLTIFTGEVDNRTAKFDLTITVWENDFGLMQAIEYDSDLFEPSTIARMGRHFERLLAQAVADPSAPLDTLQMFSQEEEVLFRQDVAVDELEAEFLF
jgi:acyl carrier protein